MPPSWPLVSHCSGLFQGTLETGWPFASTLPFEGLVSAEEQPVKIKTAGRKSRGKKRKGRMPLIKHIIANLNIGFCVRQNVGHGRVILGRGHLDLAEKIAAPLNDQLAVRDHPVGKPHVQHDKIPGAIDKGDFAADAGGHVSGRPAVHRLFQI